MTHSENHSDTLNRDTPTRGLRPPPAPQVSQQQNCDTASPDTRFGPTEGFPLGCLGKRGAAVGLGAAAISRAGSLPDPLHLTHFLFFTHCLQTIGCQSDPHQNIYNYLPSPAPQHGPRSGSIPNCSHTSHLQLFCHQNCPDSRGGLGN